MKASYFWKILLLCSAIALVLATSISYSQGAYHSGLGVKAGLNAASMSDNDANQSDMRIGMHVGFFGSIVITDGLAFQPEFLYTMKGGKMQYQNAFATGSVTFGLDYIEIPLLLVYSLSENLSLHGGVYVASLSKVSITNESSSSLFNFETEIREDDFETIDYGLVIGASTNFEVFSIGARYEYGLATVGKERVFAGRSFHFPDASNSAFQIYFAVTLLP